MKINRVNLNGTPTSIPAGNMTTYSNKFGGNVSSTPAANTYFPVENDENVLKERPYLKEFTKQELGNKNGVFVYKLNL